MKLFLLIFTLCIFESCTKKVASVAKPEASTSINSNTSLPCMYSDSSAISYSNTIHNILMNNCMPCHANPGSGGINLDVYQSSADLAKSGQMIQVVTETDPNNIMMPPPPKKHLDSCEIKALNLWIKQGCPLN